MTEGYDTTTSRFIVDAEVELSGRRERHTGFTTSSRRNLSGRKDPVSMIADLSGT